MKESNERKTRAASLKQQAQPEQVNSFDNKESSLDNKEISLDKFI